MTITAILSNFSKANNVKDEYLYNGFARVFRQQPKTGASYINDQVCSESMA